MTKPNDTDFVAAQTAFDTHERHQNYTDFAAQSAFDTHARHPHDTHARHPVSTHTFAHEDLSDTDKVAPSRRLTELELARRLADPNPSGIHTVQVQRNPDLDAVEAVLNMLEVNSMERTPEGIHIKAPGAKADAGKNRVGLVMMGFAHALTEVAKVGTFGAEKYSPRGFLKVENGEERYTDAMLRHLLAEETGTAWDKDSHLLHAAHCAWNALARLELMLRKGKSHV